VQTKLTKTSTFFQFLTSIKIELPKIASSGSPEVPSKVSNPNPRAEAPSGTERHNGVYHNSSRDTLKFPLTGPLKTMVVSPGSDPDVVEKVAAKNIIRKNAPSPSGFSVHAGGLPGC
jgi:hypothetical protein